VLYFLVFVKRISRRSPRSGNVQTCQRSDVVTSFTPNSHRIISFTDPHLLTTAVSYRYKITGGEGVSQAATFSPTLPPVNPLTATLMDLPASVANKRLTVWLNPLDATLTKNRGGGPAFLGGMPSNPHSGTHLTVAYLPLFSITSTMPILQLLSFDGLPSNGGWVPPLLRISVAYPSFPTPIPFLFISLRTLLHSPKSQLFCFQTIPHSFAKTPGGRGVSITGGRLCFCGKELSAPNWRLQTDHCQLSKREEMGTGARGAPVPEVGR